MNKKAWIGISAGLVAVLLVVLWFVLRPTPPNATRPVCIGILKHESSLPIYIAEELGYFKKHGVQVELVEVPPW